MNTYWISLPCDLLSSLASFQCSLLHHLHLSSDLGLSKYVNQHSHLNLSRSVRLSVLYDLDFNIVTAADTSQALTFRFSWQGFFFFSGSLSHHSESSFFCAVDDSLYLEFMWYRRCTPVLPMLAFLSFVVALDTSIALAFPPWVPRVSEMFAAGHFVPAVHILATGS